MRSRSWVWILAALGLGVPSVGAPAAEGVDGGYRLPVPAAALPAHYRQTVLDVMARPTISVTSDEQTFPAVVQHYMYRLDHPENVAKAWRRLGVPALQISGQPDGKNLWRDGDGTEVAWRKLAHSEHGLVWYAQGEANAGALLPNVPGEAVAVLWHQSGQDDNGRPMIRHRVDLYIRTDSRAARLLTRLLGPAAPRMAKDGADQLLMFFAGPAKYLEKHPEKAEALLAD